MDYSFCSLLSTEIRAYLDWNKNYFFWKKALLIKDIINFLFKAKVYTSLHIIPVSEISFFVAILHINVELILKRKKGERFFIQFENNGKYYIFVTYIFPGVQQQSKSHRIIIILTGKSNSNSNRMTYKKCLSLRVVYNEFHSVP